MWNVFDVLYGWFAIRCQRAELVSCCRIAFLRFPSRDIVLPQIIICTTAPAKPVSCTLAMYMCVSEIEIKLAIELSPVLHQLIKSPRVTRGTYCFWSVSAAAAAAAAAVLPALFNFPGKPLRLISSNHTWLTYGCGKIFWHPSRWPRVKVTKLPKRDVIYLVPTIKSEPLIQSLQNLVGISPSSCFSPD